VIDPLFLTLGAIIPGLELIYIYISRDERGKRKVRKGTKAAGGGRGAETRGQRRGRKSHANTSLRRPFGAADPPK